MNEAMKVELGLKEERDLTVLQAVLGQLSDGKWENSRAMEKYWRNLGTNMEDYDTTGPEVVLNVGGWLRHEMTYGEWNPDRLKKWLANKIKLLIKDEQLYNPTRNIAWKRDCNVKSEYLSRDWGMEKQNKNKFVTIGEAYYVYDKLMGRDTNKYTYAK